MRGWVGLLLVGACAVATWRDLPRWQSDPSLWLAAAYVADTPRVAVNMARLSLLHDDVETALLWDEDALRQAPNDALVHRLVTAQLRWILVTSPTTDLCTRPRWASWCASS